MGMALSTTEKTRIEQQQCHHTSLRRSLESISTYNVLIIISFKFRLNPDFSILSYPDDHFYRFCFGCLVSEVNVVKKKKKGRLRGIINHLLS